MTGTSDSTRRRLPARLFESAALLYFFLGVAFGASVPFVLAYLDRYGELPMTFWFRSMAGSPRTAWTGGVQSPWLDVRRALRRRRGRRSRALARPSKGSHRDGARDPRPCRLPLGVGFALPLILVGVPIRVALAFGEDTLPAELLPLAGPRFEASTGVRANGRGRLRRWQLRRAPGRGPEDQPEGDRQGDRRAEAAERPRRPRPVETLPRTSRSASRLAIWSLTALAFETSPRSARRCRSSRTWWRIRSTASSRRDFSAAISSCIPFEWHEEAGDGCHRRQDGPGEDLRVRERIGIRCQPDVAEGQQRQAGRCGHAGEGMRPLEVDQPDRLDIAVSPPMTRS